MGLAAHVLQTRPGVGAASAVRVGLLEPEPGSGPTRPCGQGHQRLERPLVVSWADVGCEPMWAGGFRLRAKELMGHI